MLNQRSSPHRYAWLACWYVAACEMTGCARSVPLAPSASVVPNERVAVATPPPPAMPEEVPATDSPGLVWADGCWQWGAGRWVWLRGGWVKPPQGGTFFRGQLQVQPDGQLLWSPCTWFVGEAAIGLIEPTVPAAFPPSPRTVHRE